MTGDILRDIQNCTPAQLTVDHLVRCISEIETLREALRAEKARSAESVCRHPNYITLQVDILDFGREAKVTIVGPRDFLNPDKPIEARLEGGEHVTFVWDNNRINQRPDNAD